MSRHHGKSKTPPRSSPSPAAGKNKTSTSKPEGTQQDRSHGGQGSGKGKNQSHQRTTLPTHYPPATQYHKQPSHGASHKSQDHRSKKGATPQRSLGEDSRADSSPERQQHPTPPRDYCHKADHRGAAKDRGPPNRSISAPTGGSQNPPSGSRTAAQSRSSLSPDRQQHEPYSTTSQSYGAGLVSKGLAVIGIGSSRQRSSHTAPSRSHAAPSPSPATHYTYRRKLVLPKRADACPRSIADYRNGYPDLKDDKSKNANYEFYIAKIPFQRNGVFIDNILKYWWGRYDILEQRHDYIQWLFPTQDGSDFNYHSQPLQKHEKEAIRADPEACARVIKCYEMMLDFYGMKLCPSGEVKRSDNYRERFAALNTSSHNLRRITRILKSLGEFDYEHLKPFFLRFVLEQAILYGLLENTLESCMKYWVETIIDEDDRDSLWLLTHSLVEERNCH